MISLLKGKIFRKSQELTVIETGEGVGYGVVVSSQTYGKLPDEGGNTELIIHTNLSINSREGNLELFGFYEPDEENMFKKLIGIAGIGPRAAIKILSAISATDLAEAIVKGNLDKKKIPGMGQKRALAIMNELKGKVFSLREAAAPSKETDEENIISALKNYGFKNPEIESAMKEIREIANSADSIETAVKKVLSIMKK